MRLLADANIVAPAVRALRARGDDVSYTAERESDPGDEALLAEAVAEKRVFLTKDRDLGALVFRDGKAHAGVLLIDDLGDVAAEIALIVGALDGFGDALSDGAFLRAGRLGVRRVT